MKNRTTSLHGSSFQSDIFAIKIYLDKLVLLYPGIDNPFFGQNIHSLAPLLALGEPVPTTPGAVCPAFFPPGQAPILCDENDPRTKKYANPILNRPMGLPPETEWVLFDTNDKFEPKWLVRLCDFRRITLSKRNKVYVVFNDFVFEITPLDGDTGLLLFKSVDAQFPKRRDIPAQPDEVTVFSVWSVPKDFKQPYPVIKVKTIRRLESEVTSDLTHTRGDDKPLKPNRLESGIGVSAPCI